MRIADHNVVLVVADTLSAFHLPLYGYGRDTAPFLTSLANDNAHVTYGYANGPFTVPAHGSLFSGDLPSDHGCTSETMYYDADSFVEDLAAGGYGTLGVSNNPGICPEFGFARGFDEFTTLGAGERLERQGLDALAAVWRAEKDGRYDSRRDRVLDFGKRVVAERDFRSARRALSVKARNPRADLDSMLEDSGAAVTNRIVRESLADRAEPFFCFLNYMEPHRPYDPPNEYAGAFLDDPVSAKRLHTNAYEPAGQAFRWAEFDETVVETTRRLYDAEIRYLDDRLRELYEWTVDRYPDTVFVIVGDHGENIGDYGMQGHQCGIWEKLLRVPIIVAGPDVPETVIERNVSLRHLGAFLTGREALEDLGAEEVRAEYTGLGSMFDVIDRDFPDEVDDRARRFVDNDAKCVVSGRHGLVEQSHLPDGAFAARPDGYDPNAVAPDPADDLYDVHASWFSVTETAGTGF